ncbi:ankyrin repeat domain-containing protein [Flavobacterium sp. H122]|uniref:ankyrin repeat domain-containing protein n=1 Tax=Flavobacterium sp. H122 TaxID=2529860 RepID=UPI0010AB0FC0|nr:ankyrin repeat domain-containing protein [Flavobacterium sp. H122]
MKSTNQKAESNNLVYTGKKAMIMLGLALGVYSTNTLANQSKLNLQFSENELVKVDHSPICKAIIKGDVEAVKKFIEYGVNVNETSNGLTPLMLAARFNNVEIVKLLLQKGADRKIRDEKGYDALKYAEMSKAADALDILMRA